MSKSADTNWNRLKRSRCFSSDYVASIVGVDRTTVNAWFGGRSLPNSKNMHKLCDLFGIDQTTGCALFEADKNGVFYDMNKTTAVTTPPLVVTAYKWRELFDTCGNTRIEIATYCNVHPTTVSNWMTGRFTPNPPQMSKLSELFKLPIDTCYAYANAAHNVFLENYIASDTVPENAPTTNNPVMQKEQLSLKDILGKFIDYEVDPSAIYMFLTEYKQCAEDTDAVLLNIYGKIEAADYQKIYQIVGLEM